MEYSFQYNKAKVLQGLRLHFVSRPEIKILAYAVNIFAILSAILYWLKKIRPEAFLLCSLLWIVIMVTFWLVMPNIIYKKAIRTFQDHFIATFNESGIDLENERGTITWEWTLFSNYFETSLYFHLYFNSRSFFLFPKAQMDKEFILELRKLLKSRVKNAKY